MRREQLYRDPENGRVCGVCAGLAAYLGAEVWWVRIIAVSAFLLGGGFVVILLYLAACLILDKMPEEKYRQQAVYKEHQVKQKPWQSGRTPSEILHSVEGELDNMEKSLRKMEAYVTSTAFKVEREFKKL